MILINIKMGHHFLVEDPPNHQFYSDCIVSLLQANKNYFIYIVLFFIFFLLPVEQGKKHLQWIDLV